MPNRVCLFLHIQQTLLLLLHDDPQGNLPRNPTNICDGGRREEEEGGREKGGGGKEGEGRRRGGGRREEEGRREKGGGRERREKGGREKGEEEGEERRWGEIKKRKKVECHPSFLQGRENLNNAHCAHVCVCVCVCVRYVTYRLNFCVGKNEPS